MSNIHEYSIIEKIDDIEAKNMMFSIPYLAKIKKKRKKDTIYQLLCRMVFKLRI